MQADPSEVVDPLPVAPPESLPPVEPVEVSAGEPDAVDIEPGTDPEVALVLLENYVGLPLEEFTAEAKASGFSTRIVMQDGESLAVTMDYRLDRVNVAVDSGIVVKIESIG